MAVEAVLDRLVRRISDDGDATLKLVSIHLDRFGCLLLLRVGGGSPPSLVLLLSLVQVEEVTAGDRYEEWKRQNFQQLVHWDVFD